MELPCLRSSTPNGLTSRQDTQQYTSCEATCWRYPLGHPNLSWWLFVVMRCEASNVISNHSNDSPFFFLQSDNLTIVFSWMMVTIKILTYSLDPEFRLEFKKCWTHFWKDLFGAFPYLARMTWSCIGWLEDLCCWQDHLAVTSKYSSSATPFIAYLRPLARHAKTHPVLVCNAC